MRTGPAIPSPALPGKDVTGSRTVVDIDAGHRQPDGAIPRSLPSRVVVFSSREVIAYGVVALLPEDWRDRAAIVSDLQALERALERPGIGTIIDAEIAGSSEAIRLTRARGGSAIVLLGSVTQRLEPGLLDEADAVLVRDEVEPLTLRIALAAGRLKIRVLPRSLPSIPAAAGAGDDALMHEPARTALMLLAEGRRDADIALELNLSESAVRKLVQRTVHSVGARTRCQAVAIAARAGQLS
jgi:DNA-binding NarL/FixJ family response regulator